ncbi:MAG: hypothetical protein ABJE95_31490 [Byssovorax sp.]
MNLHRTLSSLAGASRAVLLLAALAPAGCIAGGLESGSPDGAGGGGGSTGIGDGTPSEVVSQNQVSSLLVGQNLWLGNKFWKTDAVDKLWPQVKASGVNLIRIGGRTFNDTSPSNQDYLAWVTRIKNMGAQPLVQVSSNLTPKQASDLVHLLNDKVNGHENPHRVRFWGIGNEPSNHAITVNEVSDYVRSRATAMKLADPNIKIFAPDLGWFDWGYIDALIGNGVQNGKFDITGKSPGHGFYYIDGVTIHTYPASNDHDHPTNYTRADVASAGEGFGKNAHKLVGLLAKADNDHNRDGGDKLEWGVGEFNITTHNRADNGVDDFSVTSFLNGQYFAEVYGAGMKEGATFVASWSIYESGNRGDTDLGYLDGDVDHAKPRSSYWHTKLVADHLHGNYADGSTNRSNVTAFGARDGNKLTVMILNKDQSKDYTFDLHLDAAGEPKQDGPPIIHINGNVSKTVTAHINPESTAVLVFDGQGKLTNRINYTIADAKAWKAPH